MNVGKNKRLQYVHEDGTSLVGNEEYFFFVMIELKIITSYLN